MSNPERSLDQQAMANMSVGEAFQRISMFSQGRLQIWSSSHVAFDFEIPGQWLEVRDASAIFVRGAKYRIRLDGED